MLPNFQDERLTKV